jgi:hypothetical protein
MYAKSRLAWLVCSGREALFLPPGQPHIGACVLLHSRITSSLTFAS